MGNLVLRSTYKGYLSSYFWSMVWFIVLWAFNGWLSQYIGAFRDYDPRTALVFIGGWGSIALMAVIAVTIAYNLVYSPLRVDTFFSRDKRWRKVTEVSYGFPFSRNEEDIFFDRITKVTVEQSSIDRLVNTGSLIITLVTYINGEADETDWTVPGISDPVAARAHLTASEPGHEGFAVTIRSPNEN